MTDTARDTPALDELWAMIQDQQTEIERQRGIAQAQQAEIEELKASLQGRESDIRPTKGGRREPTSRQPRDGRLSRAGLLKGAVAGLSGVAAAELAGTIGASPAAAAKDTSFIAEGGSGAGFATDTNTYDIGVSVFGHLNGVVGTCSGSNATAGVLGGAEPSAPNASGVTGISAVYIGVIGEARSAAHTGIWGYNSGNGGWGVYGATYTGDPNDAGTRLGNGVGVRGESAGGTGVYGTSVSSYGGHFSGGLAPLLLDPASTAGPPSSGSHQRGEVVVDVTGSFWICTAAGTPGTWRQLKTTDQGFHSFPNPRRVFGDGTVIAAGTTTTAIDVTGAAVPAGASSVYCAVQATNPGVLTLFPDGATDPGVANWANTGAPGQLALFYMLVPLSAAGRFKIHTYLTGQVYVDVWGYLLS